MSVLNLTYITSRYAPVEKLPEGQFRPSGSPEESMLVFEDEHGKECYLHYWFTPSIPPRPGYYQTPLLEVIGKANLSAGKRYQLMGEIDPQTRQITLDEGSSIQLVK